MWCAFEQWASENTMAMTTFLSFTMGYFAYYAGGNINVKPQQVDSLSDEDVRILEMGSKMEFVTWYTYPSFVWVLKFSIIFFYRRLTKGLIKDRTLKFLFLVCGLTWVALIATVSSTCWPFHDNWTVRPLPGEHCIFRAQNFYALAVLNVITDVFILTIPAPMLWHLRLPLWKRVGVTCLLCGGLFVISAAIIRAALTLTAAPSVLTINIWGYRETVVALLAVTAPVLSPLFRPGFWKRGARIGRPVDALHREAEEELGAIERRRRRLFSSKIKWDFGSSLMETSYLSVKSSMRSAIMTTTTVRHVESDIEAAAPQTCAGGNQGSGGGDAHRVPEGGVHTGMDFITGSSLLAGSEENVNLSRPENSNYKKTKHELSYH
ncbi:uncharacterized protein ColSpa_12666 [Colletotrichum spaethianum]|uniref:Rhodopsin domain-containing protein n=1 Tax=Colletotrichum spaethianum TaxID=700344 RepID=A0AA37UQH6_9PEZI|nr:uncharacterized protein ColSpa_12666 [Colletotrichum spaethianum]GKT52485.1 hypothetical protein ColSpa_12666 [Colletotrichum spaethianum]